MRGCPLDANTPAYASAFMQAYNKKAGAKGGNQKSKKFELTEEQKQEIREAFDLFDTDGSGKALFATPQPLSHPNLSQREQMPERKCPNILCSLEPRTLSSHPGRCA